MYGLPPSALDEIQFYGFFDGRHRTELVDESTPTADDWSKPRTGSAAAICPAARRSGTYRCQDGVERRGNVTVPSEHTWFALHIVDDETGLDWKGGAWAEYYPSWWKF